MTLSNVTRRGMIGGLAAGVSAAAVIRSDTFIGYACCGAGDPHQDGL